MYCAKHHYLGRFIKISVFFYFLLAIFAVAESAQAANLYFSPSSGTYGVGRNFNISVMVNSDSAMNSAEGLINFPTDKLEVIGLSKEGIVNLWVQEPSFSNAGAVGNVSFAGVVLNPGFTGSSGKLLTIHFRARAEGTPTLKFVQGSVLANDGQGTNILSQLGQAFYALEATVSQSTGGEVEAGILPPVITYFPKYITSPGQRLVVEGIALPDSNVEIKLALESKKSAAPIILSALANKDGRWYVFYDDAIPSGTYALTAKKVLKRGVESPETTPVYIKVNSFLWKVWQWIKKIGFPVFILLVLLLGAAGLAVYLWKRIRRMREGMRKETHEAKEVLERGIGKVRTELLQKELVGKVSSDLEKIKEEVEKEIDDIGKKY